ncbi:MAG: SLC13 family permease [Solirubrobacteraceae bacterium]
MHLSAAAEQAWPPFVLVSGLLLIGLVAHRDGLFEQTGRFLQGLAGPPVVLLAACLLLVAVVTAVLNLDTAVVFLTPVLVHAARGRGIEEEAFLYGTVYMANAASLYLLGSNLTNLLVLDHQPISGGAFAARMLVIALAATLATMLGLFVLFRRRLRAAASQHSQRASWDALGLGLPGALAAAVLTIALRNPAIPVLVVGLALTAIEVIRGRLQRREVVRAVGPVVLIGLFLVCVALRVLARSWNGPAQLLAGAGRWGTTGIGALASVTINNLPAAVLLSARPVAHPSALLLGLNVGPNIAATGSLSAFLWWRAARQVNAQPSLLAFSRRGAPPRRIRDPCRAGGRGHSADCPVTAERGQPGHQRSSPPARVGHSDPRAAHPDQRSTSIASAGPWARCCG